MRDQISLLPLTEGQLEEQLDVILNFLIQVHPNLNTVSKYHPCVEIRPIYRSESTDFMLSRSLNLWDLSDESISRLQTFLERHNGQPTCLYYSVYNFDNSVKTATSKGKPAIRGKITAANARSTNEIALDFDNIGYNDYIQLVDKFESIGLYALWVSSGHGYQAHILLSDSLDDKELLKRFVYKFRSKGFNCDPKCIDPARVMRLPGTYNCKCFVDDAYADEVEPPQCYVIQDSVHRYDLEFILAALDKLPTVSEADELIFLETTLNKSPIEDISAVNNESINESVDEDSFSVKRIEYPYINEFELPDPVNRMLRHTPKGYRNSVLGFLVGFFKNYYRLGKDLIYEILLIWAENACNPAYSKKEFKSDFSRFYYEYKGLPYTAELSQKFGFIDFDDQITIRKKDIFIPAAFFKDFKNLDGKTIRLYLAIKLLEHKNKDATIESISKVLRLTDRAVRTNMKDLLKSGHAYVTKGNRRNGIPNTYHTHRGYSLSESYLSLSYNDVLAYVNELKGDTGQGNNDLKLYLFMRYKYYSLSGKCFMTQQHLGEQLGLAKQTISEIVVRLEACEFISIRKVYRLKHFSNCEYTLLR